MTELVAGDRLLVLGGSGFIGSHLPDALAAAGVEMVSFDLHPFAPVPGSAVPLRTVQGDVRDLPALTAAMQGCTAVLNLAAAHHDFGITRRTFEQVNVDGARNVVAAMQEHGVTNLCFYSSVAVYGSAGPRPDETTEPAPVNDYGRTKLAAEGVYRAWEQGDPQRRALVIRPAVVFGPRNYANVFRLVSQIDRRRFVPVGPGVNRKSMCYVTNIVAAILHLWQRPTWSGLGGAPEVYNYVDGPDLTSREIVARIYRALGRREPRLRLPLGPAVAAARPLDALARVTGRNLPITSDRIAKLAEDETSFDGERVRATGFRAPVALPDGLDEMVAWYRAEGRHREPVVHLPPELP